jgi:hypothetical protein
MYAVRNPEPFYWAKRKTITEIGIRHCRDISVSHSDELFVLANGLIVKNSKHSGGMGSAKRSLSGFDVINRFLQVPEESPDRAPVSNADGIVSSVEAAPQGGSFINIGDDQHYIPPEFSPLVKPGQQVEAGEPLSEGIPDAEAIARLRGVGEGRRYYAERLKQILDDSGMTADRRNTELLARAHIDHMQLDEFDDSKYPDVLPDDVLSYNKWAAEYTPPATAFKTQPFKAVGKFLQAPTLHYTIGTRVTPRIVDKLKQVGVEEVYVDDNESGYKPAMPRLRAAGHGRSDWMAKLHGSYLKTNLQEDAARGADTNIAENIHFAPRLSVGVANGKSFGQNIEQTGKF